VKALDRKSEHVFTDLLGELAHGSSVEQLGYEIVLTFMAVLEMARLKLLHVEQQAERGEILIRRVEGAILPLIPRQGELPFDAESSDVAPQTESVVEPSP
jgi:chromatin segregation and condensation protein Rec8/ScpA/Scc1 (kleisin family)